MMLNSAQHARSAASRLDDVIDRSALGQAREGLGGRDMKEAAYLGSEPKKSTFEVRGPGSRSPHNFTVSTMKALSLFTSVAWHIFFTRHLVN